MSQILRNLKAISFGTVLMFLLGYYVKLLDGFQSTSTLILTLVILSFRSKNSNPSVLPTCMVNLIFAILSIMLRKSKNKKREAEPCPQTTNNLSQNSFLVVGPRSNAIVYITYVCNAL